MKQMYYYVLNPNKHQPTSPMKKHSQRIAISLIAATLLLGAGWQWFWFNWNVMVKAGTIIEQYEEGDNRIERD